MYGIFIINTFDIMKKNYYVYKLTDKITGEFYLGSRGCDCETLKDNYMGSPKVWKPNKSNLLKQILKTFDNRRDAILFERQSICEVISNELNMNFSIPHPNITRENLVTAKDKTGKIVTISSNDPLLGIDFFGVTKWLVLVKDNDGNIFFTDVNDPRYINGELTHNNKGLMTGTNHPNFKKIWVNNGYSQKLINIGEEHIGWVIGTLQKGKETLSSHNKTIWIHNIETKVNKRVYFHEIDTFLSNEWVLGRINLTEYKKNDNRKIVIPDLSGYKWVNKDNINKRISEDKLNQFLSDGWVFGRVK